MIVTPAISVQTGRCVGYIRLVWCFYFIVQMEYDCFYLVIEKPLNVDVDKHQVDLKLSSCVTHVLALVQGNCTSPCRIHLTLVHLRLEHLYKRGGMHKRTARLKPEDLTNLNSDRTEHSFVTPLLFRHCAFPGAGERSKHFTLPKSMSAVKESR